jgi:hypothetical protein
LDKLLYFSEKGQACQQELKVTIHPYNFPEVTLPTPGKVIAVFIKPSLIGASELPGS